MTGYEEQLLARAEELEDTGQLVETITTVLTGAQLAGIDWDAAFGLGSAVRELDPDASISYDAGSRDDRHGGRGYASDGEFLEAVSEAEDDVRSRLREAVNLQGEVAAVLGAAHLALAAAYAMPTKEPCTGCHAAKAAAIADAERRIGLCEATAEVLDPLTGRLRRAAYGLHQVPEDLGEVYALVYEFIREGGKLPVYARWIEGKQART
jgi:hypothetical protein